MDEPGKTGGRARTWPQGAAAGRYRRPHWADALAALAGDAAGRIKSWSISDVGPGRLVPWLPIAFGLGIVIYFAAEREPAWWAGLGLALAGTLACVAARNRPMAFPILIAVTAMVAGFATATLKSVRVGHIILATPIFSAEVAGFIEVREERERSDRIVVRVHTMEGVRINAKPERVRVSVRKGTAPLVGAYVTFKARLNPPLGPLRPGGYDYARDLYFQRIGAIGFVLGQIKAVPAPVEAGLRLTFASSIGGLRDAIDARIRSVVAGDNGSIASALITGKRDAISASVNDAMYVSSLAHILSISGYHMAIVAGVVFFIIRASLALIPAIANRRPIKKWAAFGALLAAAFYLLLSGAEVATQRSFIMAAIVLLGVMADRPALTLRMVAVAAIVVLLIAPEAIVHPSFQMSFAATLALVAGYQHGLPWFTRAQDTSLGARIALWGGREIAGLILASLLAGLATMPFAAYHFHRIAPYGVLANLLAMPIVSVWVMPAGMLAVAAIPFGFDAPFWRLMGEGIAWMTDVAQWVASLPGSVGRMPAFGVGPLVLGTGGLVMVCLLRSPLRWGGAGIVVAASFWAVLTPQPDLLISHDGRIVALRTEASRLSVMKTGTDVFAVRAWLSADADPRDPKDATLADGTKCDAAGCIGKLREGRLAALSFAAEAFEEDCRRAVVVVSPRDAPAACAALLIDRKRGRASGAMALYWNGENFAVSASRPAGYDRPWAKALAPAEPQTPPANIRRPLPDATPRPEDLEPGDQ